MDFGGVFQAADAALGDFAVKVGISYQLTFHLSPGTSAMATAWVLLAKTKYPARLIQSSLERGVEDAQVPFDISAELVSQADQRLASLPTAGSSEPVAF